MDTSLQLIDSHCHLDDTRLSEELDAVIDRAQAAGVGQMVTIGASEGMEANHIAVDIASRYPHVYATVGIHPHEARTVTPEMLNTLEDMARGSEKVIGIGETGLDYYYDNSPRAVQQEVFRQFIDLARRCQLPIVIHLRDAYDLSLIHI